MGAVPFFSRSREVFSSWGVETTRAFTAERLEHILTELDGGRYGAVLRCKGIVPGQDGGWLHFDYVPEEHQIRSGPADPASAPPGFPP